MKGETLTEKILFGLDVVLVVVNIPTLLSLLLPSSLQIPYSSGIFALLAFLGLIPVAVSAIKSLLDKKLSVDLLAAIALIFSLLSKEWVSAAFITLMLAFARLFDRITEVRAKKTIQSLMKYNVERVHRKIGDTIEEVHISAIKTGDIVVVEAGDRMPVDGIVESGEADVNEASLTGESELVHKKIGSRVYTSTVNESGSLIVKTEKVGADTTLSRMIALVEEAGRDKNEAERAADRFTQWYILLSLVAVVVMYFFGLSAKEILAVLLVVCADDIAVAIPLAFTAAISHAARRGVIVKGSSVFEQLAKMKFVLTDKTGTLTKGKPKIVDIRSYDSRYSIDEIATRFFMGASESNHIVSKAMTEYAVEHKMKLHTPDDFEEVSGKGIVFKHDGSNMLMGRLSFMQEKGCTVAEQIPKDIISEKDNGRGVACLAVDGVVVGLISYQDELRPRVKEIINETKELGVEEWHMLTGDNEKSAAAVSAQIGIRHYHANMTPEGKVDFIRHFEKEHSGRTTHAGKKTGKGIVGYIGDGVNDAASLALADVSIAMGGIGADAAIEASDITIMKDHLDRLPETMKIARKVRSVMKGNFWIWGITNIIGLGLVAFGVIGPAGAATYNFLTDFIPIVNALRAGRK
ncbi:MAG: cation-translocating P-type ATPase [Patescibacteria group bacterium]